MWRERKKKVKTKQKCNFPSLHHFAPWSMYLGAFDLHLNLFFYFYFVVLTFWFMNIMAKCCICPLRFAKWMSELVYYLGLFICWYSVWMSECRNIKIGPNVFKFARKSRDKQRFFSYLNTFMHQEMNIVVI